MPAEPSHSERWQTERWQTEGAARFCVGDAFFRTSSKLGRDLAVLAASAYRQTHGKLRILDAMTGCGVRPLRYALEANADFVWANEGNPDLHSGLLANLGTTLPAHRYRITHQDANAIFFDCYQRQDFYDLIDIDSFGSPMPTLSTSLWAVKLGGLVYLTSTDGRATSGHAPDKSLQTYGAYARSHPAVHEQGLRLLIGSAVQQSAARGLGAEPVFSWHHGEVNRVMMRVTRRSSWRSQSYGFLAYCHDCGQFQTVSWKKLGRVAQCICQTQMPLSVSGPMWLGSLHGHSDLMAMANIAAAFSPNCSSDTWADCRRLLSIMQAESSMPPYYYPLAEIGRRGKMDIPPRDSLIQQLQAAGFKATRTHIDVQAIKTTAPLKVCIQLAQQLSHSASPNAPPPE